LGTEINREKMDLKSTIFIFGAAFIFILPLVISSPIGGGAGVSTMEMCDSPYTTVTTSGTTITSPNWPYYYPNDKTCETTIEYPTGKRVSTQFDGLQMNKRDYLEIFDGDTRTSTLIKKMSGRERRKFKVESSSTAMTLHFNSDKHFNDKGFTSIAKQMGNSACTLSSYGLKQFKEKHVDENAGNATLAATKSCQRNIWGKNTSSGKNSVLFLDHQPFRLYTDDTIVGKNCQSSFPDVWQCKDVQLDIGTSKADLAKCISETEKKCWSCKPKFPSASEFEVEVAKSSGHLHYEKAWYTDEDYSNHYKLKYELDFNECRLYR